MTRCTRFGVAAAIVAALAGLAGCGGKPSAAPSASASGLSEAQVAAILQEYTQCMRDHGLPGFEQPKLINGRIQGGRAPGDVSEDAIKTARDACEPIAKRLPSNMWRGQDPNAAELEKLRQWAACLRQHGIPDWPDPDSRGRFAVMGTPLQDVLNGDRGRELLDACRQYSDGNGVRMTQP